MRLARRRRSCCSSSARRDHSRSSTTAGSPTCRGRNRCGSVRSPAAATRASRRSSFAPATLNRSRRRSSRLGLIACTAKPRSSSASTTGPCGTSIATATVPAPSLTDASQRQRAARPAPPCGNSRLPTTFPAASSTQTWCFCEPQSTPANQPVVTSVMVPFPQASHEPPRRSPGSVSALEGARSEEHTSELQSRQYLVCRLLLEKKKNKKISQHYGDDSQTHHLDFQTSSAHV